MMIQNSRGTVPAWLTANRNLILFSTLLILIVMLPTFEGTPLGEWLLAAGSAILVVVSVAVNGRSRVMFWLALILSGPAVVVRFTAFANGYSGLLVWSWGLTAAVLLVTMVRLLQEIFSPGPVTRDKLFGCATVYLLIGLVWCFVFAIVEEVSPGAFSGLNANRTVRIADLAYFSFNIVTNVALTNTVPVSRTAQVVVLLQEFASVLYMAFVISRLVGMYAPAQPPAGKSQP